MNGYYSEKELKQIGLKTFGENVLISKKASIYTPNKISIGHDVRIDDFCVLVGDITIGNYIHIAPYVGLHGTGGGKIIMEDFTAISANSQLYAGSDDYSGEVMTNPMVPEEFRKDITSTIVMKKHSIVALNCILIPGAVVGEGTALSTMSVLSRPTDDWWIYAGIPARKIKERSRKCEELEKEFFEKYQR